MLVQVKIETRIRTEGEIILPFLISPPDVRPQMKAVGKVFRIRERTSCCMT